MQTKICIEGMFIKIIYNKIIIKTKEKTLASKVCYIIALKYFVKEKFDNVCGVLEEKHTHHIHFKNTPRQNCLSLDIGIIVMLSFWLTF